MMNAKVSGKGNDWPNPPLVTTIDLLRMKKKQYDRSSCNGLAKTLP